MESRHVSRVIAASPESVYAFIADPANLPQWAAGLTESEVEVRGDSLDPEHRVLWRLLGNLLDSLRP